MQESMIGPHTNGEQRYSNYLAPVLFDASNRPVFANEDTFFREVQQNVATASQFWTACAINAAVKAKNAAKAAEIIGQKGKEQSDSARTHNMVSTASWKVSREGVIDAGMKNKSAFHVKKSKEGKRARKVDGMGALTGMLARVQIDKRAKAERMQKEASKRVGLAFADKSTDGAQSSESCRTRRKVSTTFIGRLWNANATGYAVQKASDPDPFGTAQQTSLPTSTLARVIPEIAKKSSETTVTE
jgi:hypothetical protein